MDPKTCSDWYTCHVRVWCLQIYYEGSSVQKTAKFGPHKSYFFDWKLQTRNSFLVMVVQPKVYFWRWRLPPSWIWKTAAISSLFDRSSPKLVEALALRFGTMTSELHSLKNSRWWSPPSWISKNCCHYSTHWAIIITFNANIATLIWSLSMTSEMHSCKNSNRRSPPSWISKTPCHFFSIWPILEHNHLLHWKCIVVKIQNNGRRHLEFRKTVVISLLGLFE